MAPTRIGVLLLAILGAVGLGLAAMGLHGIVAYGLAVRRREIGIRLALGASPGRIFGLFLKQAAILAVLGISIGAFSALATSAGLRWLVDRLPEPGAASVAAPSLMLLVVVLAAAYFPARTAARTDPAHTLHFE